LNGWQSRLPKADTMSNTPRIAIRSLGNIGPEQAHDARARAWAYVFECWQARRGDSHDLTNDSTEKWTTRQDMKGKGNADIHGD
jgi:hypothetical protein